MPTPAEPAPNTTIFWSTRRPPETRTPASTQARPTAAVPWMSSSKVHRVSPYRARMPARRRTREVLPVQDRLREPRRGGGDVGVDERVVRLAPHPGTAQPEVARVVEQLLGVRAHVQPDRQDAPGVDAGRDRVDGELADRDVDATDAPVTDAQDRLGVGGDHQVDVVGTEPGGVEGPVDAVDVLDVEEDAPGPAEQVAELLDGRTHGGRVDDRQHLVHVLADQPVEEHLVAVVQLGEEDPLLDVGVLGLELLVAPVRLLLERLRGRRQQPVQAQAGRARPSVNAVPRLISGSSRTASPRAWICTAGDPVRTRDDAEVLCRRHWFDPPRVS